MTGIFVKSNFSIVKFKQRTNLHTYTCNYTCINFIISYSNYFIFSLSHSVLIATAAHDMYCLYWYILLAVKSSALTNMAILTSSIRLLYTKWYPCTVYDPACQTINFIIGHLLFALVRQSLIVVASFLRWLEIVIGISLVFVLVWLGNLLVSVCYILAVTHTTVMENERYTQ